MNGTKLRLAFLGLIFLITACSSGEIKSVRLQKFTELLNANEQTLFEQGKLDAVEKSFSRRLSDNKALNEKYTALKHFESIDLFSNKQVIAYFYESFYLRLSKK